MTLKKWMKASLYSFKVLKKKNEQVWWKTDRCALVKRCSKLNLHIVFVGFEIFISNNNARSALHLSILVTLCITQRIQWWPKKTKKPSFDESEQADQRTNKDQTEISPRCRQGFSALLRYDAMASKTPAVISQNLAEAWTKPDGMRVETA